MLYLIGQIILCLLFTFVIGATVGWMLRGLGSTAQAETIEARWRARLSQLQQTQQVSAAGNGGDEDMAAARQEVAALRLQLQQRDAALEAVRRNPTSAAPDNKAAADQAEQSAINARLQGHLAEQKSASKQMQSQLDRLTNEKDMLIQRLREREAEIGRMSQERKHAINTIAALQKEMRNRRVHSGLHQQAPPAVAETNTATDRDSDGIRQQRQQVLPIRDEAVKQAPGYQPAWLLTAPNGAKDNLQAIYGIGPKLEMQLNRLGIFHFEQIAKFTEKDILWVARHLKSFPGRIVRDQWIQQARTLAHQTGS